MLTLIEREAWEAGTGWKAPAQMTVIQGAGDGQPSKAQQTIKRQSGDSRYRY